MGSKNQSSKTEKVSEISSKEGAKEQKKKMGRPRIEIDFELLADLCALYCTRDEICSFLKVDDETLSTRIKERGYESFSTYYKKHLGGGKISLRRLQWKAANEGSIPMLIWLGKQVLGQKDKIEQDIKEVAALPQFVLESEKDSNINVDEEDESTTN